MATPSQITLEIRPRARFDLIDVQSHLQDQAREELVGARRAAYSSHHTTAGFVDPRVAARLHHSPHRLTSFLGVFRHLFPEGADYEHDKLHLRAELSEIEKQSEPKNADSHLTFISSGLANCVTYDHRPNTPVYLVDLDGVHEHGVRTRKTTVVGYQREEIVGDELLTIPLSHHPIDSVNLWDPALGLAEQLSDQVAERGIETGRLDLELDADEAHAGLTVNEYESLLMEHDVQDMFRDPLRFVREHDLVGFVKQKGKSLLRDPRSIPQKTLSVAQYDLVQLFNEALDAVGVSESLVERLIARFLAFPASKFFGVKRSVSLLVSSATGNNAGPFVQGTYQSPILVQWRRADQRVRRIRARFVRFV